MPLMSAPLHSNWQIPSEFEPTAPIRYNRSIRTPARLTITTSLIEFVALFAGGTNPTIYEVFDRPGQRLKLYFDIDIVCEGIPTPERINQVLEDAQRFLNSILGGALLVISEAHRSGKISFHIVCINRSTTDRNVNKSIAKLGASKGLGFDPAVYLHRQLMRPAYSMGEKDDSVPLIPRGGQQLVYHIVQALTSSTQDLPSTFSVAQVPSPKYESSGLNVLEDLIALFDFTKITVADKRQLLSIMKAANLRKLFDYQLRSTADSHGGQSFAINLDSLWNGTMKISSRFDVLELATQVYNKMTGSSTAEAQEILKKYNLQYTDRVCSRVVPNLVTPPPPAEPEVPPVVPRALPTPAIRQVPETQTSPALTDEERILLRLLLDEKIAALTHLRDRL